VKLIRILLETLEEGVERERAPLAVDRPADPLCEANMGFQDNDPRFSSQNIL
jgi:hypothetical protein